MSFYVNFLSSPLSDEQLLGTIDLMIFLVHVFFTGLCASPCRLFLFFGRSRAPLWSISEMTIILYSQNFSSCASMPSLLCLSIVTFAEPLSSSCLLPQFHPGRFSPQDKQDSSDIELSMYLLGYKKGLLGRLW